MSTPSSGWFGPIGRASLVAVALLGVAAPPEPLAGAPGPATAQSPAATDGSDPDSLLAKVRATLQAERTLLLEYTYREKRQPIRVSSFGKVTVGEPQVFDVLPSGDPDRPQRVLVSVAGRPATKAERDEYARRHSRDASETAEQRHSREQREAEARRRAQERFDDAFRVFRFEAVGTDTIDGVLTRLVRITPRTDVEPRSDIGRWMTKFKGTAWVEEGAAQLVHLELVATDTISLGWGVVGRIAEGTTVTYSRRPTADGQWFPAKGRLEARGRTLLFRSFELDSTTEWYDYRPYAAASIAR